MWTGSAQRAPRRRLTLACLAVLLTLGCGGAERFPAAPIVLICPWAAGGGSDRIARQVAVLLEQDLHVPVNVVNATGGDGVTGHSRGALARPDGYTMTLVTVELASLHWRGMTNISPADFAPVALVNRDAAAVFVRTDAPWRTVGDLQAAIKAAPGQLRASGTATAGIWHLALAGWLTQAGLQANDVIWVSIAGSAPSLQELVAGGVDIVVTSLPEAQPLVATGRVRSLGVMADERAPQFPDVPTFREQGVEWTLGTVRGMAVPKDTPPDRVRVLSEALGRVVQSAAYRDALISSGFGPDYEAPAAFRATLQGMDVRLGGLLRSEAFANLSTPIVGARFFPSVLAAALTLVLIGLGVSHRKDAQHPAPPADPAEAPPANPSGSWVRFAEVVLWIVIYLAVSEYLGFILTAAGLLVIHLLRMGTRPIVAVPVAALLVPLLYQIFGVVLRVPLPRGVFGW